MPIYHFNQYTAICEGHNIYLFNNISHKKHILSGHFDKVYGILITYKYVLSWCFGNRRKSDFTIRVWNVETGECEHILKGHTDIVCNVVMSSDNTIIISASMDNTIRICNLALDNMSIDIKSTYAQTTISLSPDDQYLLFPEYSTTTIVNYVHLLTTCNYQNNDVSLYTADCRILLFYFLSF